jgi:hypothetical protein
MFRVGIVGVRRGIGASLLDERSVSEGVSGREEVVDVRLGMAR